MPYYKDAPGAPGQKVVVTEPFAQLRQYAPDVTYSAMYLPDVVAGAANYLLSSNGSVTILNGVSNTTLRVNNLAIAVASSTGMAITGSLTTSTGFGCNAKPAQTSAAVNAASTDLATVVALCNQLRAALIANGISV